MPIYPENFVANSLSGTILVTNGFANVALPTNPFALEGDKNFVIKLRKGGINGLVIATSPTITVRDPSQFVSLTANVSTVAEGNLVTFTLVTANATDNSNVFYSVFPVTANVNTADFVGANVGRATIINNQATFTFFANADYSIVDETGETFRVQLRENGPTGNIIFNTSNVTITDFYRTFNVFNIVESSNFVVEGANVVFTVFAHNIPLGNLLYYYTTGNADITGANIGSIAMNGVSNTVTISTSSTIPTNESRLLSLVISATNMGPALRTSNIVTVADPSLLYINASGGSVSTAGGFRVHTFTSSDNFVINAVPAISPGTVEYLIVGGGGGGGGGTFPPPGSSPPAGYSNGPTTSAFSGSAGGGGGGGVLVGNISVAANTFPIQIGGGGGAGNSVYYRYQLSPAASFSPSVQGGSGSNSTAFGFTAYGGGGGGWAGAIPAPQPLFSGVSGGSGGGAGSNSPPQGAGGSAGGVVVPGQGNPGGGYSGSQGGGGGGATQAGLGASPTVGGNGGRGAFYDISGANVGYGGGGGGASDFTVFVPPSSIPLGGAGGGGNGAHRTTPPASYTNFVAGISGSASTGGGGGGAGKNFGRVTPSYPATPAETRDSVYPAGAGGSGVVIIRYPYA